MGGWRMLRKICPSKRAFPSINPLYFTTSITNNQLNEPLLQMAVRGHNMKFDDYNKILNDCVDLSAFREGQRVHAHMIKTHYSPSVFLSTRLIVFYKKCDYLDDARRVLDEMPETNVVSWTAMITGYSQKGLTSEALNLFVEMLRSCIGFGPNQFTFTTVLTSCIGDLGFHHGTQIHSLLVKSGFEYHIFVGSSLLDMYAKSGKIHDAHRVFDDMPERDVVSCTALISGYAQLGLDEEAIQVFRKFRTEGMSCNYVTYASLLTAISGLAAFDHGKQVHNQIIRTELPNAVVLHNSLIDMYSKCGSLSYARTIFNNLNENKNVISWNAMLVGYSKNGLVNEAEELFERMKEENTIRPNNVTYLAMLSSSGHGGNDERGMEIFEEMLVNRIEPEIEHYGCVVDLLGRSGQISRAVEFIKHMPIEPTAAILGSLLGACRVHSEVGLGEVLAKKLEELEPENAGNYVILSNLYASAGRWEDMRNLRKRMNEKAVMKEPGRSWIEINRTVHTFHASDVSHPMKDEAFEKVREMLVRIKEAGYVPDLGCVGYDVDEEQKEKILLGHSEKLALGFGMIYSCSEVGGKAIRIMKNLRICVDCHSFVKYVSKVYGREIYLRDTKRFHHFVGGICSCKDYW
ncbi:putative pentatricopeptide repeat-containing protein At3g13770, mitochondrial [Impatiens glandulifera]|uniref:putative pentatricopeptide repeat-containing protein At3g13770, mitochondrial n=1 Tax=Impatiens glandulifera TaxID=253017 RepID=UPI001FB0A2F2|nr:putative pentatricopeptide repeat-containing protein At3g13770, mitochondrial [Impatiens glandulifera]